MTTQRASQTMLAIAALALACSSEVARGTDTGTGSDTSSTGKDTGSTDGAQGPDCLESEPADHDLLPEADKIWDAVPLPSVMQAEEVAEIVPLGDVDGDGRNDLFVARRVYDGEDLGDILEGGIVFGHPGILEKDAQTHVSEGRGFTIEHGSDARLDDNTPVAAAGDVNGDGMHDIAVPAFFPGESPAEEGDDAFVVVPGQSSATAINLDDAVASLGFVLRCGSAAFADLRGAGDINGDGLADVAAVKVWEYQSPGDGFVVFGPGAGPDLTAEEVVSAGAGIAIRADDTWRLQSVRGVGDWNGDGRGDLGILLEHRPSSRIAAIVASPPAEAAEFTVSDLVADSVLIRTEASGADVNDIVGLGDMNGDGLSDLGVLVADAGWCLTGRAYVVFGRTDGQDAHLGEVAAGVGGAAFDPAPAGTLEAIASNDPFGQGGDVVVLEKRTPAARPFDDLLVEYRAYAVLGGSSLESGRLDDLVELERAWGVVEREPRVGTIWIFDPPWAEVVPWQGITEPGDHGLAILVPERGNVHVKDAPQ